MGPPGPRAQQGGNMQPGSGQAAYRHPGRPVEQQRSWHGSEAPSILEETSQEMLVGRS